MRRNILLFIVALFSFTHAVAEIKPVSNGVYKTEYVGGVTDIYVKLLYTTGGNYYAFSLKCANQFNPSTFMVELGKSPQEAMNSVNALFDILDNGQKGEIYSIDETTSIKRQSKNLLYIYRVGEADPGYVERRHLNATRDFLHDILPQ